MASYYELEGYKVGFADGRAGRSHHLYEHLKDMRQTGMSSMNVKEFSSGYEEGYAAGVKASCHHNS